MTRQYRTAFGVVMVMLVSLLGVGSSGAAEADSPPTFTQDVAPILFENCSICHRPGEIAPMSLLTYKDARPWARAIKEKVMARVMPPWFADPEYGEFSNARALTQDEIDTIVAWAEAGAPQGDDVHLPPVPTFASGWGHPDGREPDAVIDLMEEPFELPAEGEIDLQDFYVPVPFSEDRFAEALEMRPSNFAQVHHARIDLVTLPKDVTLVNSRAIGSDGMELDPIALRGSDVSVFDVSPGKLISYVPGRGFEQFPSGVGKRIPMGQHIYFNVHYQATGRPETDLTRTGVWFSRVPLRYEVVTGAVGQPFPTEQGGGTRYLVNGDAVIYVNGPGGGQGAGSTVPPIPPHVDNYKMVALTPVTEAITLYALHPHMHLRGKDMTYIVTYPDGSNETILSVPNYSFEWQLQYELAQPLNIPAGSMLLTVSHFDNSIGNRYNPAPDKEVYWSEQSWDEMNSGFIEYVIDAHDLTKATEPKTNE